MINFTACLMLGFFLVWTSERVIVDPRWRIFVAIGLQNAISCPDQNGVERDQVLMGVVSKMGVDGPPYRSIPPFD